MGKIVNLNSSNMFLLLILICLYTIGIALCFTIFHMITEKEVNIRYISLMSLTVIIIDIIMILLGNLLT